MGKPAVGEVVLVDFPFSDLSATKKRPALVLVSLPGEDLVVCMITSQAVSDVHAVRLTSGDFEWGSLPVASNVRPTRVFTCHASLVSRIVGEISVEKLAEVRLVLARLFSLSVR